MGVLDRVRLAADVLLHGVAAGEATHTPPLAPPLDPWQVDQFAESRQAAALSMFDDDVVGYVLVTIRRAGVDPFCGLDVSHVVAREWWPYVQEAVAATRPEA